MYLLLWWKCTTHYELYAVVAVVAVVVVVVVVTIIKERSCI